MKNDKILRLQYAAGLVLQQICALLQVSREDFSSVLVEFLEGGGVKEKREGRELTVLGYFQKLPQKYFVRDDNFELFKIMLENAIRARCDGEAMSKSWEKHGDEILSQLDRIHEKAVDAYVKTTVESTHQKIKDLLSD